MKKTIKITAAVIAFLIVFILTAPLLFKGKLFDLTKAEINKVLTAKVEFDFGLNLFSNFPNLTVNLENVEVIGKDAPFVSDTLISMKKLSATVDIMSVINGESIAIKNILIDNPNIHAIILKDSSANYNIMKVTSDTVVVEEEVDTSSTAFAMQLDLIEIKNANIIYDDQLANMYAKIDNYNMTLSGDFTDKSTIIKTLMSIDALTYKMDGISYLSDAEFSMDANIDAQFEEEKYTLKENVMKLNALELSYDGWLAFEEEDILLDFTFGTNKTDFKTILSLVPGVFMEGFEDIKTSGDFKLSGNTKGKYSEITETYPSFNLDLIVENGTFKYPDLPKSVDNIKLDLSINNPASNLDSTVVNLKNFSVSFAENPFSMNFLMKYPMSDSYMKAGVDGKIDLNTMGDFIPLDSTTVKGIIEPNLEFAAFMSQIENEDYEAIKALGKLVISEFTYIDTDFPDGIFINSANLEFSSQYANLQNCNIKIGKSDMALSGKLENFIGYALADETISGSLDFYSSYLDLNSFLSEETEEVVETNNAEETEATSDEEYETIEVPGNIDFVLQTKIDRLIYDVFDVENLAGVVTIKDSKVNMENLTMNTLDGKLGMNGFYATTNQKPKAFFALDIKDVNIIKLYETFSIIEKTAPIAKYCSGKVSTKISFDSDLENGFSPVLSSFNGFGEFETTSLSLKNSDLQNLMVKLLKQDGLKEINAKDILMFFEIENGKIHIKPFETNFNNNKVLIEGNSGLDQSLDYKIALQMPRKEMGVATNSIVSELETKAKNKNISSLTPEVVDLTFLITGKISDPKINLAWGNTTSNVFKSAKDKAAAALEAEKQRIENEARAKAEEAKQQAKVELEKKADEIKAKAKVEAEKKVEQTKETIKNEAKNALKGMFNK